MLSDFSSYQAERSDPPPVNMNGLCNMISHLCTVFAQGKHSQDFDKVQLIKEARIILITLSYERTEKKQKRGNANRTDRVIPWSSERNINSVSFSDDHHDSCHTQRKLDSERVSCSSHKPTHDWWHCRHNHCAYSAAGCRLTASTWYRYHIRTLQRPNCVVSRETAIRIRGVYNNGLCQGSHCHDLSNRHRRQENVIRLLLQSFLR